MTGDQAHQCPLVRVRQVGRFAENDYSRVGLDLSMLGGLGADPNENFMQYISRGMGAVLSYRGAFLMVT